MFGSTIRRLRAASQRGAKLRQPLAIPRAEIRREPGQLVACNLRGIRHAVADEPAHQVARLGDRDPRTGCSELAQDERASRTHLRAALVGAGERREERRRDGPLEVHARVDERDPDVLGRIASSDRLVDERGDLIAWESRHGDLERELAHEDVTRPRTTEQTLGQSLAAHRRIDEHGRVEGTRLHPRMLLVVHARRLDHLAGSMPRAPVELDERDQRPPGRPANLPAPSVDHARAEQLAHPGASDLRARLGSVPPDRAQRGLEPQQRELGLNRERELGAGMAFTERVGAEEPIERTQIAAQLLLARGVLFEVLDQHPPAILGLDRAHDLLAERCERPDPCTFFGLELLQDLRDAEREQAELAGERLLDQRHRTSLDGDDPRRELVDQRPAQTPVEGREMLPQQRTHQRRVRRGFGIEHLGGAAPTAHRTSRHVTWSK